MMVQGGVIFSFSVFFNSLELEFGWSRAVISGAASLSFFMMGVGGIFTGYLADRLGPRPIVAASAVCFGTGLFFMSRVSSLWQFYVAYGIIVAAGMSSVVVPCLTVISQWFVRRRGMMVGIVSSAIGLGMMLSPVITANLISSYGWRTAYLSLAITAAAILIIAASLLRQRGTATPLPASELIEENTKKDTVIGSGISYRRAIRTRQFWMIGISLFCFGYCTQTISVHMVPFLTDNGIAQVVAAGVIGLIGIVNIAGRLISGSISDKFGSHRTLLVAFLMMILSFGWLLVAGSLWMYYLFAVVYALAFGALATLQSPVEAEFFGIKALGAIFGSIHFILTWGSIGSVISGYIYDTTESYRLAFIICVTVAVIGTLLMMLLRPVKSDEIK